jgi:hypothetical protein
MRAVMYATTEVSMYVHTYTYRVHTYTWTSEAKDCVLQWKHHNLWKQGFWAKCFQWLINTITSRPHTKFKINCSIQKKIESPIVHFIHSSKLAMRRLRISRADYHATSARRRTSAHPTVVRRFLCCGYVLSKKVSCELMKEILIPYHKYDITRRPLVLDN